METLLFSQEDINEFLELGSIADESESLPPISLEHNYSAAIQTQTTEADDAAALIELPLLSKAYEFNLDFGLFPVQLPSSVNASSTSDSCDLQADLPLNHIRNEDEASHVQIDTNSSASENLSPASSFPDVDSTTGDDEDEVDVDVDVDEPNDLKTIKVTKGNRRRIIGEPHNCHLCSKTFGGPCGLKDHLEAHSRLDKRDKLPIICETCGKSFTEKWRLTTHLLSHGDERPYKCSHPNCEAAFKSNGNLQSHLETHASSKSFRCPIEDCSKRFRTQKILSAHLKSLRHTGIFKPKSYKCTEQNCEQVYLNKSSLDRHLISAHGIGGELPTFECGICKKSFTWKVMFDLHVRGHTEEISFKCDYTDCTKSYKKKTSLVEHIRGAHTGEQPFVCHLCGKAFHRSHGLRWHMGVHGKSKDDYKRKTKNSYR